MSYHQIRNHRMHEEFRFEHRNHHRPHRGNFYQNTIFGDRQCGCQGGYENQFGYGYPEPPRPSFFERIFPFAAAGFLGYQVGKAPGDNFLEKASGFLGGLGKALGGILGGLFGGK